MLTKKQRKLAKRVARQLNWLNEQVDILVNDPMTSGVGAPVGDIIDGLARKHRKRLDDLHTECLQNGLPGVAFRIAWEFDF